MQDGGGWDIRAHLIPDSERIVTWLGHGKARTSSATTTTNTAGQSGLFPAACATVRPKARRSNRTNRVTGMGVV